MSLRGTVAKEQSRTNISHLAEGNRALREKNYPVAIARYLEALQETPALGKVISFNMAQAKQRYRQSRNGVDRQRVAVCGWELSHNAAGRVYTLAQLYQTFADTEIIGSFFPKWGRELWEPIRGTSIPVHSFVVEDEKSFLDQALQLVVAHPYDIVHLSKPRISNIFIGILYKMIWDAKVLVDIDDEELAFVGADSAVSIEEYTEVNGNLPAIKDLTGTEWTRIAVGMVNEFDGITVSNPVLQKRYGGEIIRHARDENRFQPSPEVKRKSREKFNIPQDKKVVLFFGTPRKHKGLEITAEAIAALKRKDVIYAIIGEFTDVALKERLKQHKDVEFLFLGFQPFDSSHDVIAVADCCVLLQDTNSVVSRYQSPAKLADAIGMGIPVLATPMEPFAEEDAAGAIIRVNQHTLSKCIAEVLDDPSSAAQVISAGRNFFLAEVAFSVNAKRLQQVMTVSGQNRNLSSSCVKLAQVFPIKTSELLDLHIINTDLALVTQKATAKTPEDRLHQKTTKPHIQFEDKTELRSLENKTVETVPVKTSHPVITHQKENREPFLDLEESSYSVDKEIIYSLGLFDGEYYLEKNPDIKRAGVCPFKHYMERGWIERRSFHSKKYDFNKYINTYSDIRKSNLNPLVHYVKFGKSEGRHLFLTDEYMSTLNGEKTLTTIEYAEHKARRGKAQIAVFAVNFDANGVMEDPVCIDHEIDYIYFGVPGDRQNMSTVWEYRPMTFFIDNYDKLTSFCCYNMGILLPEYTSTIYLENQAYINNKNFGTVMDILNKASDGVYVTGKAERLTEGKLLKAIMEIQAASEQKFNLTSDANGATEVIRPNCVAIKKSDLRINSLFSDWWLKTLKFNVDRVLPVDFVNTLGGEVITDVLLTAPKPSLKEGEYREYLKAYFDSIVRAPLDLSKYKSKLKKIKITIVVPVFNALDDVKQCLFSIETSTHTNYNVVIADDASEKEVVEWLEEYASTRENVMVLKTDQNLGYTINVNRAISAVEVFDYLILLNSDTIVHGNWMEKLLTCFFDDKTVGIAGPLSNAAGWQSAPNLRKDNSLPDHLDVRKINEFLEKNASYPYSPISDLVNGFCMCISKKVLSEVGVFDEQSFPKGYGEEDDFCMRARAKGFKNVLDTSTYVYHSKSKSFGHSKRVELATAGRQVLDSKYGKEAYLLLTESIGRNPLIEAKREQLRELYVPYRKTYSVIGEEICKIETENCLHEVAEPKICVHLHLHYVEMAKYFSRYLNRIPFNFDLLLTVNNNVDEEAVKSIFYGDKNRSIIVRKVENRGRDVFPFINAVGEVYDKYDYALHIHTKKSAHNPLFGTKWMNYLMGNLLYNENYIKNIIYIMKSTNVGLVIPPIIKDLIPNYKWGKNKDIVSKFFEQINVNTSCLEERLIFPAGNMFWVKTKALKKLFDVGLEAKEFPAEPIPIDGTLAHALERAISYIVMDAGFTTLIAEPENCVTFGNEKRMFKERLLSMIDIETLITKKIEQKVPFALIRYFDGEGAFYKSNMWNENFLNQRMSYYFGEGKYTRENADEIRDIIIKSLDTADIVGIPNLDIVDEMIGFMERYADGEVEKLPHIRRRYSKTVDCNSAWRILSSFELVINALPSDADFCTKDVHYDMVLSGLLYRLIDKVEKISIIASQPVAEYIEKLFGKKIRQYFIPQRAIDNKDLKSTKHYPHVYRDILEQLGRQDLKGELFLVGAGPLGKGYCQKIKECGGVALDIGAVFDSWMNFHTRPEHTDGADCFNNDLLLTSENIKRLTLGQVVLKKDVGIEDLPEKKINKYLKSLYEPK